MPCLRHAPSPLCYHHEVLFSLSLPGIAFFFASFGSVVLEPMFFDVSCFGRFHVFCLFFSRFVCLTTPKGFGVAAGAAWASTPVGLVLGCLLPLFVVCGELSFFVFQFSHSGGSILW